MKKCEIKQIIVDAHADTLAFCIHKPENFLAREGAHLTLPAMEEAGIKIQVLAVCASPVAKPASAMKKTLQMISAFWDIIDTYQPRVFPVLSKKDLCRDEGIGLLLALEGAEGLNGDPQLLKVFVRLGVRMLSLTWNRRNLFADGIGTKKKNGFLTQAGRDLVTIANKLGVIVDVSHLHEDCFWEILTFCRAPIIASHTGAKKIKEHPRNLTDKQLQSIANAGGVIGINYYPPFVGDGNVTTRNILDHIKYIVDLVGADHVGLGSDFDGIEDTPLDLKSIKQFPNLVEKIYNNFTGEDSAKILGKNWLRLFMEVLPDS
mgnify:CR=1 FL=1